MHECYTALSAFLQFFSRGISLHFLHPGCRKVLNFDHPQSPQTDHSPFSLPAVNCISQLQKLSSVPSVTRLRGERNGAKRKLLVKDHEKTDVVSLFRCGQDAFLLRAAMCFPQIKRSQLSVFQTRHPLCLHAIFATRVRRHCMPVTKAARVPSKRPKGIQVDPGGSKGHRHNTVE